jgi:uncharacterized protein
LEVVAVSNIELPDDDFSPYEGKYKADANKQVLVIAGQQRLAYFEPSTGDYRIFTPMGNDVFTAGTGFKQPSPIEVQAEFQRNITGQVVAVLWTQNEQQWTFRKESVFAYEDVTFQNGNIVLAGRLTKPITSAIHPALVMVHGSGAVSRYEFQPLAELFASLGIAVLTYDKRGVGSSSGQWQSATYQELAEDALAGLKYLQLRSDITPTQIGMWGISQGGWLVLLSTSLSRDISFIIAVSTPGLNPSQQELWRVEHMLQVDGFSPADIQKALVIKQNSLTVWQSDNEQWNDFISSLAQIENETWFPFSLLRI